MPAAATSPALRTVASSSEMVRPRHIMLIVRDWPVFGRTMSMSLDRSLYPTADDLAAWARGRFGPGILRRQTAKNSDERWEYERDAGKARGLLRAFTFLLNRSYD
jgi:hypothetical protein